MRQGAQEGKGAVKLPSGGTIMVALEWIVWGDLREG